MKRILIAFAQYGEAEGTVKALNALPVSGEMAQVWKEGYIPCLYQFDQGYIAITSVGLHAAQMAIARYAHLCDEVWNYGLAGALQDTQDIGHFLTIGTIGKYIPGGFSHGSVPSLSLKEGQGKLISSDFPIHDLENRKVLAEAWDVVDMEGYGIAYACEYLKKPFQMHKIVSDFASPGGRELIRQHTADLSKRMAQALIQQLS